MKRKKMRFVPLSVAAPPPRPPPQLLLLTRKIPSEPDHSTDQRDDDAANGNDGHDRKLEIARQDKQDKKCQGKAGRYSNDCCVEQLMQTIFGRD